MLAEGRRRSFSIASAPGDGRLLELHVRRASSSGFTAKLFDSMRAGTLLRIEGPLAAVLVAARIPRPPLHGGWRHRLRAARAMLRQLIATGDRRPVTLYWGGRGVTDLYERAWLEQLERERPGFSYRPVLSDRGAMAINRGRAGAGPRPPVRACRSPRPFRLRVYASGPPR